MKTREWIFTIAIISLIQFIIQMAALIYSNESNILNYVSFAGTIVSIILAIIAIVYSFVQTISQQSTASNISNQVDKLISVVGMIDESKNTIRSSIEHLNKSSEKLDAAIANQTKINHQVETLSKRFSGESFLDSLQKDKSINEYLKEKNNNNENIYEKVFTTGALGLILSSIYIYYGAKIKIPALEIAEKLAFPSTKISEDDSKEIESFLDGMITVAWQALLSFGMIMMKGENKNHFELHPEFEKECEAFIDFIKNSTNDKHKDIKEIIDECIKIISID